MNRHEISKISPHKEESLLLDEVSELHEDGVSITGSIFLTGEEVSIKNHYKDELILPGASVLDGFAQTAGVLFYLMIQQNPKFRDTPELRFLAGSDKARFKKVIRPGKKLFYHVTHVKTSRNLSKFDCVAKIDGAVVAKAIMLLAS